MQREILYPRNDGGITSPASKDIPLTDEELEPDLKLSEVRSRFQGWLCPPLSPDAL